jgi:hypothetical protein
MNLQKVIRSDVGFLKLVENSWKMMSLPGPLLRFRKLFEGEEVSLKETGRFVVREPSYAHGCWFLTVIIWVSAIADQVRNLCRSHTDGLTCEASFAMSCTSTRQRY